MSRRRHQEVDEDWLITYADTITILMAMFIIMLSVSKPSAGTFEELRKGFMSAFTTEEIQTPFSDIYDAFTSVIEKNQLHQDVSIHETDRGIVLEFSEATLFQPGSAIILPRARPMLDDLVLALSRFEYDRYLIEIEGHTDDVPISTPQFPSNWELSTARASAVVRYFISRNLPAKRLKASGFADSEPKLPTKDSFGNPIPENRAANRRIALRLEKR